MNYWISFTISALLLACNHYDYKQKAGAVDTLRATARADTNRADTITIQPPRQPIHEVQFGDPKYMDRFKWPDGDSYYLKTKLPQDGTWRVFVDDSVNHRRILLTETEFETEYAR